MTKLNLWAYLNAWFAYIGKFFTILSNITNVVRDSFSDLHIPKKENYIERPKSNPAK